MHAKIDLDDPAVTNDRLDVIRRKGFLNRIYREWYSAIEGELPAMDSKCLEIGSGAGFLEEYIPNLLKSDIMAVEGVELVFDACDAFPASCRDLRAIVMINAFHHLAQPERFLTNASTALRPGGRLLLVEPWKTKWSSLIYRNLHHEPFDPDRADWAFESSGPLSDANGASPWIIFKRDVARFASRYPEFELQKIVPLMPFSYLLSGGFSGPSLAPAALYGLIRYLERTSMLDRSAGLFALISIEKKQ